MRKIIAAVAGLLLFSATAFGQQVPGPNDIPDDTGNVSQPGTTTLPGSGVPENSSSVAPVPANDPQDILYNQAVTDFHAGKLPQAAKEFEDLIKKDPKRTDAHRALGYVYLRQSRFADAALQLETVLKNMPTDWEVHDNLGITYLQLNRPTDAMTQFQTVLTHNAKDKVALTGMTQAQNATRRTTVTPTATVASTGNGTSAVALKAASAKALVSQGASLQKAGKFSDAADAYRKAADLDPKNAELWLFAGSLYAQAGSNDKAIPALTQALTLDTAHKFEAHILLGQAYAGTDRGKAIAEFQQATQLQPTEPSAWYNLGVLQEQAGQTAEAKSDYQKAIDLNPADPGLATQVKNALANLKAKK